MLGEDYRDSTGRPSDRFNLRGGGRKDYIDLQADKLICEFISFISAFCPAELKDNVFPLEVAEIAQAGAQRVHLACPTRGWSKSQVSDPPHFWGLLSAYCKRPRSSRTTDKRDEISPPHVSHQCSGSTS